MRAMAGSRSRYGTAPSLPGRGDHDRARGAPGQLALYSVILLRGKGAGRLCRMASASIDSSVFLDRAARARTLMAEQGIDVLLLSVGHDLPVPDRATWPCRWSG